MSLWGVKQKDLDLPQKAGFGLKPVNDLKAPAVLDEDCLSCSIGKYRPFIKEAFKMACIDYKPSLVPFKGRQYKRTQFL
jgi:hypothetical protein